MEDEDGHTALNANNRVEVHVTGAGRLLDSITETARITIRTKAGAEDCSAAS